MAFVLSGDSILHCLPGFWIARGRAGDGRYFQAAKDFLKASRPPAEQRSGINTRVLPKRALLPLRPGLAGL
jgi:hypothetical protein